MGIPEGRIRATLPIAYSIVFTQVARRELVDAQDWYESEASGLGRDFRQKIDLLVTRMTDNPRQFPIVFKNVRRALAHRFPYSLYFVADGYILIVIACFHAIRDPAHWQQRT